MIKRSTFIQIVLFLLLATVSYFYITNKAIKTEIVTVQKIVTVVDTVTTVKIEERWHTRTETIRDTAFVIRPDTILVSVPTDAMVLTEWKEWIIRMVYSPPKVEFTTNVTRDSTQKYYIYDEIPWGFMVEPNADGFMTLQLLYPENQNKFTYGWAWGPGYEFGSGLAVQGNAWLKFGKWRLNGIASLHLKGLRAGVYVDW